MLKQIISITLLGLRSIPERLGASLVIVVRTCCMTLRRTTIAETPSATQPKKNSKRPQDVRISRLAMRRMNIKKRCDRRAEQ